jgi:hypothetical protein
MRPSSRFFILIALFLLLQGMLLVQGKLRMQDHLDSIGRVSRVAARLGITDLCLATDARYIRHLSVSDPVAPYMDHPGGVEHFPSSSFWAVRD